tara:strand:- start:1458 stop:1721 length:264 start_codon:yes stop_codon:yes gene_type:complete
MPIPHNLKKEIDQLFLPQVRLNVTELINAASELECPTFIEGFFNNLSDEAFPPTYPKKVCIDLAINKWEAYLNIKEQEHNHNNSLPR